MKSSHTGTNCHKFLLKFDLKRRQTNYNNDKMIVIDNSRREIYTIFNHWRLQKSANRNSNKMKKRGRNQRLLRATPRYRRILLHLIFGFEFYNID